MNCRVLKVHLSREWTSALVDGFSGVLMGERKEFRSSIEVVAHLAWSTASSGAGGKTGSCSCLTRASRPTFVWALVLRSGVSSEHRLGRFSRVFVLQSGVSEVRFQPDASQEHTSGFTRSQP
jgi:hypothetical protein